MAPTILPSPAISSTARTSISVLYPYCRRRRVSFFPRAQLASTYPSITVFPIYKPCGTLPASPLLDLRHRALTQHDLEYLVTVSTIIMAGFVEELWQSIFTPGTTPTLLIATNASFAALQFVLLLLLVATYSIHFVILSFLCAGLWASINWFAAELKAAQLKEEQDNAASEREARRITDDSDTEVEALTKIVKTKNTSGSNEVEVEGQAGELKHRGEPVAETRSGVSTEDEWEKVSENETDKTR